MRNQVIQFKEHYSAQIAAYPEIPVYYRHSLRKGFHPSKQPGLVTKIKIGSAAFYLVPKSLIDEHRLSNADYENYENAVLNLGLYRLKLITVEELSVAAGRDIMCSVVAYPVSDAALEHIKNVIKTAAMKD